MKTRQYTLLSLLLLLTTIAFSQNATVRGVLLDGSSMPIPGVNVTFDGQGTQTDFDGFYALEVPANQDVTITFSHLSHKNVQVIVNLSPNEDYELNPQMKVDVEQISTVIIKGRENKRVEGITTISPEAIRKIPGANAGVENYNVTVSSTESIRRHRPLQP